jgi:hypothetical protein
LELGVHLPLVEFGDEGQSLARLTRAVETARDCGFAAISANDHFLFQAPWLDGPTALAAELLSSYARAGCERVHLWPLGDEPRQLELAATALR